MKIIYSIVTIFLFASVSVHAQQIIRRSTRPDALSYPGSISQIVSPECAQLAQIKQCVCNLNNVLQACCSSLDMQINGIASSLETDLENIITLLGDISNLDLPISHFETLFSLVESLNISLIETLIETILGLDSSFDHVSSLIEYDIAIDEVTLAHVSKIETQIETVVSLVDLLVGQNCASANDVLASNVDNINSSIDAALALATQILDMDQTILSKVGNIDTQLDTVNSLIDFAMLDCASRSDIIINEVQLQQEQEASCCQQLSLQLTELQEDIDSRLDYIESSLEGISNIEELISQLSVLVSVIDNVDTELIVSLIDTTESGFDVVTSQLDSLSACGSTPISAATTITAPGNYCLDQDIMGNIIIASSDVTLNLNEHMISGSVTINTGLSNVIVANGFIAGGASNGVTINDGSDNISLQRLRVVSGVVGVNANVASQITNLYISDVVVENCTSYGFYLAKCSATIKDSAAYLNGLTGFLVVNPVDAVTIENSEASYNNFRGFQAFNTGPVGTPRLSLNHCIAYANSADGFNIGGAVLSVSNCFASENGQAGFNFSVTIVSATGVISDCVSVRNIGIGFNADSSNLRYTGNYAADNGIIGGTIANYALASNLVAENKPPYYWLPWNNGGAGRRVNISGNSVTIV